MSNMKFLIPITTMIIGGCATTGDGSKWTCSANDLQTGVYDGSGFAYVHLRGFATGHNYQVKLNAERTEATGTTTNGTPFVCKKSK